jgi:hypothetical protein
LLPYAPACQDDHLSIWYWQILNLFLNPKMTFLYMNLILRAILNVLVMSWIPFNTPNKLQAHHYQYLITTLTSLNVKCVTLRVWECADMIEIPLR